MSTFMLLDDAVMKIMPF